MQKIELLGNSLVDQTVKEAMRKVELFLKDGKVSTIAYITMKGLITSQDNIEVKQWIQSLDMPVIADPDILHAADVKNRNRVHEVEQNVFLMEFLKKLSRQKKTVYLICQTKTHVDELKEELYKIQSNLKIVGSYALDDLSSDEDFIINEMNMVMPNVLISDLSSPKREQFLTDNHMKMNVDIWLMLRADRILSDTQLNLMKKIHYKFLKRWFHINLKKYEEEKKSEE